MQESEEREKGCRLPSSGHNPATAIRYHSSRVSRYQACQSSVTDGTLPFQLLAIGRFWGGTVIAFG